MVAGELNCRQSETWSLADLGFQPDRLWRGEWVDYFDVQLLHLRFEVPAILKLCSYSFAQFIGIVIERGSGHAVGDFRQFRGVNLLRARNDQALDLNFSVIQRVVQRLIVGLGAATLAGEKQKSGNDHYIVEKPANHISLLRRTTQVYNQPAVKIRTLSSTPLYILGARALDRKAW